MLSMANWASCKCSTLPSWRWMKILRKVLLIVTSQNQAQHDHNGMSNHIKSCNCQWHLSLHVHVQVHMEVALVVCTGIWIWQLRSSRWHPALAGRLVVMSGSLTNAPAKSAMSRTPVSTASCVVRWRDSSASPRGKSSSTSLGCAPRARNTAMALIFD